MENYIPSKDDLSLLFQNLGKNTSPLPPKTDFSKTQAINTTNFVLTRHDNIEKCLKELKGITFARKFDVYEIGMFLGIIIGKSTKKEVVEIMKEFSTCKIDENDKALIFSYYDLFLTVVFDVCNVVIELTFNSEFKGQTSKGLRVGDTIEKAIQIYGEPIAKSEYSVSWNGISVFTNNNKVSYIRLQRN